jgi:hypothetical protein
VKKYLVYLIPFALLFLLFYYFLSYPKINLRIESPENFVVVDYLGDISLTRNGSEILLKETPFPLKNNDEINVKPFSGFTLLCKNSTILIFSPSTLITVSGESINLKRGSIEWRDAREGIEIRFRDGVINPSGWGLIGTDGKSTVLSLRKETKLKLGTKEEVISELKKLTIDNGRIIFENLERPPSILSPTNIEVFGNWVGDFGLMNVSVEYEKGEGNLLFEVSPDPYFLSTIFSIPLKERNFQIPLERIGIGKRFARVVYFKKGDELLFSEPVVFFVRAFPLSKSSKEDVPPRIDIYSVILSGNIVIVKGKVDRGCRLFVNKEEVIPEPNGEFNVPVTFNDLGEKWLEIEAVSPNGLRSSKRQRVFLVGY